MDRDEYELIQNQIMLLGSAVKDLDLDDFIAEIDHADTVGPFIDPTMWIKGHDTMYQIRQLAVALKGFQKVVEEIIQKQYPERKMRDAN